MAGREPDGRPAIRFDPARVQKLSGAKFTNAETVSTLKKLGFTVEGKAPGLSVTPPSWRPDIHGAADLVEEVVRLSGADRIPSTPLPRDAGVAKAVLTPSQKRVLGARRALAARGLVEAVTWSFVAEPQARLFGGGAPELRLANPDFERNDRHAAEPASGPAFGGARQRQSRLPGRRTVRGGADLSRREARGSEQRCGRRPHRHGAHDRRRAGIGMARPSPPMFSTPRPTRSPCSPRSGSIPASCKPPATRRPGIIPAARDALQLGPKTVLAHFGELHPETLKALDIKGPAAVFEVFLDNVPASRRKGTAKGAARCQRFPARPARFRLHRRQGRGGRCPC